MFSLSLRRLIASLSRTPLQASRRSAVRRPRHAFRPQVELLEGRLAPSVDLWTGANNAVDINWSDGKNWSLGHAPTASDVAQFTGGVSYATSVVDGAYTVGGLQIDGTWANNLYVNRNLTLASGSANEWDSGNINVAQGVTLTNNGTLTLKGSGNVSLGAGGTLLNDGTINQQGSGNLALAGSSNVATTLNNAAGATYDFQAESGIGYGGGAGGQVTNAGTIDKTAGTGASYISQTLTNSGTLQVSSGTLAIAAPSTNNGGTFAVGAGAALDLTGGTGNAFTENGTFTASGVGSGAGAIDLSNGYFVAGSLGATVNFTGTAVPAFDWTGGQIDVPVNATLTYNGLLTLQNSSNVTLGGGGTFALTTGNTINQAGGNLALAGTSTVATTLQIASGATYDFSSAVDSGIGYGGGAGGQLTNAGTIEKTAGTGASYITQGLTNSGTLQVSSGTLAIATPSTNNGGTFAVGAGATLDLTGGTGNAFTENGTFTASGGGEVLLDAGTLAAGSSGATFNIPTTVSFVVTGGSITVGVSKTLTYNGTLTLNDPRNNDVVLQGGGTFTNNGTLDLINFGNLDLGGATTLNNPAGSTIDLGQDDADIYYGGGAGGTVVNAGLIEKAGGTGASGVLQPLINTGTLDAATGTLVIDTNTTATNGTYEAAAGATLNLTGGNTFAETGTFTAAGSGTITLGGGTFAVSGNSATLNIPSTVAFQWPGSTVSVPVNDTLTVNGNLALNGTSNETLAGGGTMTENGTITQSGSGSLLMAGDSTGKVATTLVLPKGSVYDFAANSGIGYGGGPGGVVTNAGTVEKTAGGAASGINEAFNNTGGTLSVTNGTLTLDSTGGESTGGSFNVSAGAILDLTGGNSVSYSGTYTGSGTGEVLLGSGTLNVTGGTNGATFNLPGNLFVWTGGAINTAANNNCTILGNVKITGNGTEYLQGGGALNVGSATAAGTVNDTGTGNTLNISSASTLAINARGTFNIADDTVNGGGLLSNLGSLVKTAGTSGATISVGTTDNQGKVQVNNGTLLFSGAVDQVFNGVLTGGSWTAASTATTASALDISSANFNTIGISALVTLSGPNSSFTNLSGLSANQGTFNLSAGASFATAGNFINSGSMTLSPGSTLTVNGAFSQTSTGKLAEQIGGTASSPTFGSVVSTGPVSLGGTLSVTSTVVPAVGSNFEILNNGSASAITGTFAGLPEGATFTVKVGATTMTFKITYKGGSGGNSVVISRIS
jgi:hypothetical protein